jgi:diacylglycerol kinase (ATP)
LWSDALSRYTIIFNPAAGKGSAVRLRKIIYELIRIRESDFVWVETDAPGSAAAIARAATSPVVVAIGGDGTIHEVVNGIRGSEKLLGIVPCGSGNDFIKNLGIPRKTQDALDHLFVCSAAKVDLGRVKVDEMESSISYFMNGLGVGFDAEVAERTRTIRYLSGTLLYAAAVIPTLGSYKAPEFELTIDGTRTVTRNLLIAIGNGVCAGGGFYLTPDARIDDGLLDVCSIREKSMPGILRLMPSVMRGEHKNIEGVMLQQAKSICIESSRPVAVHADGEILGTAVRKLEISVEPAGVNVIGRPRGAFTK